MVLIISRQLLPKGEGCLACRPGIVTYHFRVRSGSVRSCIVVEQLSCSLQHWKSHIGALGQVLAAYHLILTDALGKAAGESPVCRPQHLHGRPAWCPGLLILAWPCHCDHLVGEPADGTTVSASPSLFVSLPFK